MIRVAIFDSLPHADTWETRWKHEGNLPFWKKKIPIVTGKGFTHICKARHQQGKEETKLRDLLPDLVFETDDTGNPVDNGVLLTTPEEMALEVKVPKLFLIRAYSHEDKYAVVESKRAWDELWMEHQAGMTLCPLCQYTKGAMTVIEEFEPDPGQPKLNGTGKWMRIPRGGHRLKCVHRYLPQQHSFITEGSNDKPREGDSKSILD